jgi:DNA-binding NarL/FixJ family response regulator
MEIMPISLLLACRNRDQAFALKAAIFQVAGSCIAGEATAMDDVLARAAATQPDVQLLEHTPGDQEQWWQLYTQLRHVSPRSRILLLCDACTHLMVVGFVRHGVSGCLPRSSDPALIAKSVIAVHRGESWFTRAALLLALRSHIAPEPAALPECPDVHELLTEREREVLMLIGTAMTNKEIAKKLQISDHTVKTHLHHIYVKLEKSGRYKAFLSNGFFPNSGSSGPFQQGGFES